MKLFLLGIKHYNTSASTSKTFLAVLLPSHIKCPFTERLSLHINSIFADEAHSSFTAGNTALAGALTVVSGMSVIEFAGDACFCHFYGRVMKGVSRLKICGS